LHVSALDCSNPSEGTRKDIFEQVLAFMLSADYDAMKELVGGLAGDQRDTGRRAA